MKKVGIIGGGQLGRMMAKEAEGLGIELYVLDPTPDCPASAFATQVVGNFSDKEDVYQFGKEMDVLTFEIESANADALRELEKEGKEIHPSPQTLGIIKDKLKQKEHLSEQGIPVASFRKVDSPKDVAVFAKEYGYPVVLKARRGAYDGRGNRTVEKREHIEPAMKELGKGLYVEAWVPFAKELAVVSARSVDGTIYSYPVVETVHTDHICDVVTAPAPVDKEIAEQASSLAAKIMEIFHGAGVFGIEMFLTKEGDVLINEIAPRVHNSGHFTIAGSSVSQFRQHLLAVCGESIVKPTMLGKVAVMKNILGTKNAPANPQGVEEAEALGAHVEIYGKHDTKKKRKMGHLTILADVLEEAHRLVHKAHNKISI